MADTNKQQKTPAKGTGAAPKKPSTAKGKGVVTATAASKAPRKPKTSASKSTGKSVVKKTSAAAAPSSKKPAKGGGESRQAPKTKKRSYFAEQYLPYIFGGLALIFAVFLVLNLLPGHEAPDTHPAGIIGYYFCQILFGCFGWAACLLPLVFVNFAIFWRRYCRENLVVMKTIVAVLLMILISSFIHVGVCAKHMELATVYNPVELYKAGTAFQSGGIVGGVLGNLLYPLIFEIPLTTIIGNALIKSVQFSIPPPAHCSTEFVW